MKAKSIIALALAAALAAAGCGGDDADAAEPGDQAKGPAFVEEVQFIFLESYPVQVRATIVGTVPTPCHEAVAEVTDTDAGAGTVTVDLYSLADPDEVCAQVLEPFEVTVDVGSFETGDYTLIIGEAEYPFTI